MWLSLITSHPFGAAAVACDDFGFVPTAERLISRQLYSPMRSAALSQRALYYITDLPVHSPAGACVLSLLGLYCMYVHAYVMLCSGGQDATSGKPPSLFLRCACARQCFSMATPGCLNLYGNGSQPVVLHTFGGRTAFSQGSNITCPAYQIFTIQCITT